MKAVKGAVLLAVLLLSACGANEEKEEITETITAGIDPARELNDKELKEIADIDERIAAYDLTRPETLGTITLSDYLNIKTEEISFPEITSEDVDMYVKYTYLPNYLEERPEEEGIEVGDQVTGNFVSEAMGGYQDLKIICGDGYFGDEIDKALVGHKKGESITVSYTVPLDFPTEAAGKTSDMIIDIKSIDKFPESVTDEIAVKEGFANAKELLNDSKAKLQEDYDAYVREETIFSRYMAAINGSEIKETPEALDWYAKTLIKEDADSYNINSDGEWTYGEFLVRNGYSLSEIEESTKEEIKDILRELIFNEAVLEKEAVVPDEADRKATAEYLNYEDVDTAIESIGQFEFDNYVKEYVTMMLVNNEKEGE